MGLTFWQDRSDPLLFSEKNKPSSLPQGMSTVKKAFLIPKQIITHLSPSFLLKAGHVFAHTNTPSSQEIAFQVSTDTNYFVRLH